jgi:protein SCO1/2
MLAGMLRILVVALVLMVGAMVWTQRTAGDRGEPLHATRLDVPRELPAVALMDQDGRSVASPSLFAGRLTLLFFGFTHCPDICPTTLRRLADLRAAEIAAERPPPNVVFISVDAERDTAERITAYLATFDSAIQGATAPLDELDPLLEALGVAVHAEHRSGEGHYNVTHSSAVFVIDPDGRYAAVVTGTPTLDELARDVERLRRPYANRLAEADDAA